MEIACNLTSGFGFKSSGEGSNLQSYQLICSHIQKKLCILKKVQVRRHSYSEHLKPILPNLLKFGIEKIFIEKVCFRHPIEQNLLKLDADIILLRLDASKSRTFTFNSMLHSFAKGGGEPRLVSYSEMCKLFSCSKSTIQRLVKTGVLPKPIKLSKTCVRFNLYEVAEYIPRLTKND